jgi:hypothetical protein
LRFRPVHVVIVLGLVTPAPLGSIKGRWKVDENRRSVIASLPDRETFSMALGRHAETVAVDGRWTIEASGDVRTWIDSRKAHHFRLTESYGTPKKVSHARERFHFISSRVAHDNQWSKVWKRLDRWIFSQKEELTH